MNAQALLAQMALLAQNLHANRVVTQPAQLALLVSTETHGLGLTGTGVFANLASLMETAHQAGTFTQSSKRNTMLRAARLPLVGIVTWI